MLMQASARRSASAHVIVVGNEKGGTGKSTVAMHLAIALLNLGQRVATIDIDSRQKTLTHYIENRRAWAERCDIHLRIPDHFCVARGSTRKLEENEAIEFTGMVDSIAASERTHDFIVIDLAGTDNHLTRLAHSMADTLVTPLNDSHIDLDVLGTVDPVTYAVTGENQYSHMVREARLQRRMVDDTRMDWIVITNRVSLLGSPNRERIVKAVRELSTRIGFRTAEGLAERVIYREFFPRGLTAVDSLDEKTLGARPRLSHVAARQEVMNLVENLKLRLDERGQQRAAAHAAWIAAQATPLEIPDFIADEAT
jgi:chromosome partitioning protein